MGDIESIDKPEHVEAAENALAGLDGESLAATMNGHSGGCLTAKAAMTVARLVGLAAMRNPGRAVIVAGVGGQLEGGELVLFTGAEIARVKTPKSQISNFNSQED